MVRALDKAFDLTVLTWGREGEDAHAFDAQLRGRAHVVRPHGPVDSAFSEAVGLVLGLPRGYTRYGWFPPVLRGLLEANLFEAIHFDHPHTALDWPLIRRMQPQARLVLDAHNVEAEILERMAPSAFPLWQQPLLPSQVRRVRALEREIARRVDLIFACSEKDAEAFRKMGGRCVRVVPNSVPPLSRSLVAQRRDVVFVGSLDWRPNAEAALLLAQEIWPLCRALLPGARLVIVGRNPPARVLELGADDVVITGSVPSVQPFLDGAFATAIPLRAGSGTRIKILEAWAAGVPVIASRIAAEGLPYRDGEDLIIAEKPGEFARALVRIWHDRALGQRLVREGQRTVEPFTPDKIAETVARYYRDELGIASRESAREYKAAYDDAMAATS
jgi:glycosyltransferase involved in cell wall biosynthesis